MTALAPDQQPDATEAPLVAIVRGLQERIDLQDRRITALQRTVNQLGRRVRRDEAKRAGGRG